MNDHNLALRVAESRYSNAYDVSRWIRTVGGAIELAGALLGFGLFYCAYRLWGIQVDPSIVLWIKQNLNLTLEDIKGFASFAIILLGVLVMFAGEVVGKVVSALGQTLRAVLDTAVHTSPFLSTGDKLTVVSAPRGFWERLLNRFS